MHLLRTLKKTCRELRNSVWTYSSKEIVKKSHKRASWRHNFKTSITKSYIWNATTSANNARTISIPLASLGQIIPHLPLFFFVSGSVSAGTSTNIGIRYDFYPGLISRLFFKSILVTFEFLSIQPGVESNATLSLSRKRYRTGLLTLNTSNLFSKNSMKRKLQKNQTLFDSFAKISSCQWKLRWNNGGKNTIVERSLLKK